MPEVLESYGDIEWARGERRRDGERVTETLFRALRLAGLLPNEEPAPLSDFVDGDALDAFFPSGAEPATRPDGSTPNVEPDDGSGKPPDGGGEKSPDSGRGEVFDRSGTAVDVSVVFRAWGRLIVVGSDAVYVARA